MSRATSGRPFIPRGSGPLDSHALDVVTANAGLARQDSGGGLMTAALTPTFYPISLPGVHQYPLQALGAMVSTLLAASSVGLSVYSINYLNATSLTASLVCSCTVSGAAAAAPKADAPTLLDLVQNVYVVGAMASDNATLQLRGTALGSGQLGLGALKWTSAARASTSDWPASFTEANVGAVSGGARIATVNLYTALGKLFF